MWAPPHSQTHQNVPVTTGWKHGLELQPVGRRVEQKMHQGAEKDGSPASVLVNLWLVEGRWTVAVGNNGSRCSAKPAFQSGSAKTSQLQLH